MNTTNKDPLSYKFIPGDLLLQIHTEHAKHGRDPALLKAVTRIKILHKMTCQEVEQWFKEEALRMELVNKEKIYLENERRLFLLRKQNQARGYHNGNRKTELVS